jgi:ABC-type lipoprotein release transport system permease subunit
MIWKLATRNLLRNRWRSFLTAGGVAVAVGMMVWTMSYIDGFFGTMVRGATGLETGQVLVQHEDYVDEPSVHEAFGLDEELLGELDGVAGVRSAAPRVNLYGLIGHEQRSQVGRILGVDAAREARTTPVTDGLVEGRWLSEEPEEPPAPREVVLGRGLAQQLSVGVGDELVVFLEASDGSLGNDLLEVVGVVRTGSTTVDRQGAYMHLEDAQFLGALDGRAHEIITSVVDPAEADAVASRVRARIKQVGAPDALSVRSWREALPEIAEMLEMTDASNWVMYAILYLLASLGLLNTQRMSALERRREFAIMMAIGVTPKRLFSVIVAETFLLSLAGALAGVALGGAVAWHHTVNGLDMTQIVADADFSFMGVSFTERLYFGMSPEIIAQPVVVMLVVALLCGLWPAAKAVRLEIAPTIGGRQ